MIPRLAIVASHPIQYQAPLFRALVARGRIELKVFYGWEGAANQPARDYGFDRNVEWDIPLLDGYEHEFVPNRARDPGTHHRRGIDCPDLAHRILAWNPSAVLFFGWSYRSHLRALRKLHGQLPVLFRGDSTLLDERPGLRRWLRRAWLRYVYRHVDGALYVGVHNRRYYEAHGLVGSQLTYVPYAVETARFLDPQGKLKAEARSWRESLAIPADAPVAVFAGKLEEKKAPDLLLDAFLAIDVPGAHLVVCGSGPLEAELRARAKKSSQVHFLGFQNQSRMPVVYRLGDVFVLPSRGPGETWGLAVNEAIASGLRLIVSDKVGCAPDLVAGNPAGVVVEAGSLGSLRGALDHALREPCTETGAGTSKLDMTTQASLFEQVVSSVTISAGSGDAVNPAKVRFSLPGLVTRKRVPR